MVFWYRVEEYVPQSLGGRACSATVTDGVQQRELLVSDEEYIEKAFGHFREPEPQRYHLPAVYVLPEPTGTYVERQLPWFLIGFVGTGVIVGLALGIAYLV